MQVIAKQTDTAVFTTKTAAPELAGDKWAAAFETWVTRDGDTYLSCTATSAALFDTAADAEEAGKRALFALAATGMFPNMCEKF